MRITQRMMVEQLQRNINYNTQNLGTLQDQLSSGKRLRKPSDDPPALNQALRLKVTSDQDDQFMRNIDSANGWLSAADTALGQLGDVLVRARDLALKAGNDTNGPDERKQLAAQVGSMLQEALQAANSTHEDNFVFAGQLTLGYGVGHEPPFTLTTGVTAPDSVQYLRASGATPGSVPLVREVGRGVQVEVSIAGDRAVDPARSRPAIQTAIQALATLKFHLENNSSTELGGDIDKLTTGVSDVLSLRGVVGSTLNRVDATENALRTEKTETSILLSRAQDADVAEVMTKLMNQENVYRAALSAGARAIQPSLLDFLK